MYGDTPVGPAFRFIDVEQRFLIGAVIEQAFEDAESPITIPVEFRISAYKYLLGSPCEWRQRGYLGSGKLEMHLQILDQDMTDALWQRRLGDLLDNLQRVLDLYQNHYCHGASLEQCRRMGGYNTRAALKNVWKALDLPLGAAAPHWETTTVRRLDK